MLLVSCFLVFFIISGYIARACAYDLAYVTMADSGRNDLPPYYKPSRVFKIFRVYKLAKIISPVFFVFIGVCIFTMPGRTFYIIILIYHFILDCPVTNRYFSHKAITNIITYQFTIDIAMMCFCLFNNLVWHIGF